MTYDQLSIKIRRISILNYKGIDKLELDFPSPRMPDEPDIVVLGSRNGLGKTSILECCSLVLLALSTQQDRFDLMDRFSSVNVPDLLIRAGAHFAEISGDLVLGTKPVTVHIRIDRHGIVKISGDSTKEFMIENDLYEPSGDIAGFLQSVCGLNPNPVTEKLFLFFHSYRKVQEGNPELGMMVDRSEPVRRLVRHRHNYPMSTFKLEILRSMMGQANLFELPEGAGEGESLEKLNELTKTYVGATIGKLRPTQDNTVDFRLKMEGLDASFTFDGLSSGQKEIISTLFLIWHHTRKSPCVVFIDEPELHLNSQWHRNFIQRLTGLAPYNQYILATHSEDIMDSVDENQRILLIDNQENNQ